MARRNPFDELEEFFDRMSRQFEGAPGQWDIEQWTPQESSPALDLADQGDEYVVAIDLPGYRSDDIDVRLTDQTLHVEAERGETIDHDSAEFIRHERSHESISRRIQFPEAVDADAVDATLSAGVLTVTIGKAEPSEGGKQIEIT